MGSPVQEIFQGRGGKKRQGFLIKRGLPFLLLILTYLGLLLEIPLQKKGLWFLFSSVTISVYFILYIVRRDRTYSIEFLFSLALLIAGTAQAFNLPWLRIVYFPFIVSLTAFYGLKTIIPLSLMLPLLELRNVISMAGEKLIGEVTFIVSLIATASIASLFLSALRKEKKTRQSSLKTREETERASETEGASLSDEEVMSHYRTSVLTSDEEIKELLLTARNAVFSDSVTLFVISGSGFRLRCSTDEPEGIILSGGGLVNRCLTEREPIISSDINEKKADVGYMEKEKISSFVAVPVLDGDIPLRVMAADSARFSAFSTAESTTLQMFSKQIVRILQRERVYPQLYRSHASLKILHEESSKLLSSLNVRLFHRDLSRALTGSRPLK